MPDNQTGSVFPRYVDPSVFIYKPTTKDYNSIIILAHFSPCGFAKPKKHLLTVLQQLLIAKYPVCVIEAIFPNQQPLSLPEEVIHQKIYASEKNYFFLKENLYNIAGKNLQNYDKFIFLDADICFDNMYWFEELCQLLDNYDIVQPFDYCFWTNKFNTGYSTIKANCIKCILNNKDANFGIYHPGFAWAMTKDIFNRINGFYDKHAMGGGDTALWFAIGTMYSEKYEDMIKDYIPRKNLFFQMGTFNKYQYTLHATEPKISYLANTNVYHLYHGSRQLRKYIERYSLIPELWTNNNLFLRNQSGLLEWLDIKHSYICQDYFCGRLEDD